MTVNRFTYANGLNISQARRICKFFFGDFFHEIEMNNDGLLFDIFVWKEISTEDGIVKAENELDIPYFMKYWNKNIENPAWKITFVEKTKIKVR